MNINIKTIQSFDAPAWDKYVHAHPNATLYHLSGWQNIIRRTYGHKTYYLMATKTDSKSSSCMPQREETDDLLGTACELSDNAVVGILPLVHLKHFLFGNSLVSMPFFDLGGILADDEKIEKKLLSEAITLGKELDVSYIELRHIKSLRCISKITSTSTSNMNSSLTYITTSHKKRMLLDLPASSELLMKSFKSKLRSQIRKPIKEGLKPKIGGLELLKDFYDVFSTNMRDLGSPVHSRNLIRCVLEEFPESAKIVVVYKDDKPMACSTIIGFKFTLENPWSSALRKWSSLSPNMLLYWSMLEYACDHDFTCFDFGRSSQDEGTYKFKEQWGAKPTPFHWHYISLNGNSIAGKTLEKSKFETAIKFWQKLPVQITKIIGPRIRKHIGL